MFSEQAQSYFLNHLALVVLEEHDLGTLDGIAMAMQTIQARMGRMGIAVETKLVHCPRTILHVPAVGERVLCLPIPKRQFLAIHVTQVS